jgi:hypothetical protein
LTSSTAKCEDKSASAVIETLWESAKYCECEFEEIMEFRLIYQGPLLASTGGDKRAAHKHRIRKYLHRQLAELWKVQYPLTRIRDSWTHLQDASTGENRKWTKLDEICERNANLGFRFAPLISKENGLVCSLDILFLRREIKHGKIVTVGGDLDNRIKTLLDALTIPQAFTENEKPEEGENPFFCLLSDDKLITQLKITADRLLVPVLGNVSVENNAEEGEEEIGSNPGRDVHLVIQVTTMISDPVKAHNALWIYS